MDKKYTVLVVEDNELNRELLSEILKDECNVLQASDGIEAHQILAKRNDVAAIILDIIMPNMNGFEFLEKLSEIPDRMNIPVIVATEYGSTENEEKALQIGVYDFVTKPYNPTIVKLRVRNAIEHSKLVTLETLQYLEVYDGLTGIFNKNSFMMATKQMLSEEDSEDKYAIIRFDITRFAMINAYYGVEEGDRLLKYIANAIREEAKNHHRVTYGRLGADDFCMCTRYSDMDELYAGLDRARAAVAKYDLSFNIVLIFGIYLIQDRSLDVESMIANANLAAKGIKGNYLKNIAIYDENISKKREEEQNIVNEMKNALETEQFVVYLQPKYNSNTNLPCGSEALVRWKHPEKGMIPPGVFIPVFESNGFVEPIDHYMWEHVCMLLHGWIEQGIEPNPISVNVSRVNLYNPRIVEEICELTEKYNVPKHLLQLEITESAYTDNGDLILSVINKFHDYGFTILMDDFGSGYSSLNVLKDMHVDVLKIDMKFFGKTDNTSRAETIISSVVRMAKWLNIGTVAEGVETREQVEFLKSIGCSVIQGYYFARPMPVDEYEELIARGEPFVDKEYVQQMADIVNTNTLEIDELFANATTPMSLNEIDDGEIEVLRVNSSYYDLFGYEDKIMFIKHPMDKALPEFRESLKQAYLDVINNEKDLEFKYRRYDSKNEIIDLRVELKFYKSKDDRKLVLCYFYKNDDASIADAETEEQIKKIMEMCEARSNRRAGYKSFIAPCIHMPELVNTVLNIKNMDKHAMIVVSIDNAEELHKQVNNQDVFWNSLECMLNQHFRSNDMINKTKDSEYCIFMNSVNSEEMVSVKCHELIRRLKMFSKISKVPVEVSVGVAISSADDKDFTSLYNTAQSALQKGRDYGGNRVYMVTYKI